MLDVVDMRLEPHENISPINASSHGTSGVQVLGPNEKRLQSTVSILCPLKPHPKNKASPQRIQFSSRVSV
jgi:hypothetical protein